MLKDMAFEVAKRRYKNSIGKIFSIESALVKKTLLRWFNQKFKRQFNKNNPIQRLRYESKNPKNGEKDNCVICKFPVKLEQTNFKTPDDEMPFGDFVIRYGHKFFRNIYTDQQIKDSDHLKDLESYYEIFEEYISICIGLLAYVYDQVVCFPRSDIDYETITTNKFFTNVHRLIRGKFHLCHSHITEKILG